MTSYQPDENAVAVRTPAGWILKPVCGDGTFGAGANAVGLRTPGGVVAVPVHPAEAGTNAVAVRSADQPVLLPIGCPDPGGSAPCTGPHPLCEDCDCTADLRTGYLVTISGFPNVCAADAFNGTWTVTWTQDCVWEYVIDAYHAISLNCSQGGTWRVSWRITSSGGPYGAFVGYNGTACEPTSFTWVHNECTTHVYCPTLCQDIQAGGVIVVSHLP